MSIPAPDEISMEDPLCDSSLGSMVTLDYVTPITQRLEKKVENQSWKVRKKKSTLQGTSKTLRKREEAGGALITQSPLSPVFLNLDEESMDSSGKVGGDSDWSGRGSRSRDSSTSVSTKEPNLMKSMIQSLAAGVQNVQNSSSAAAFAAAEAKKEQVATTCAITSTTKAITSMGNDVKKVAEDVGEKAS